MARAARSSGRKKKEFRVKPASLSVIIPILQYASDGTWQWETAIDGRSSESALLQELSEPLSFTNTNTS